ncbi:MAG: hypothetical protein LBU04_07270, partial [Christensenellaceae bacterium]|nr:hypothetical protein [Christensenellaceae bacterium]
LKGVSLFSDNVAVHTGNNNSNGAGGAIAADRSNIFFTNTSSATFLNNTANLGGAIWLDASDLQVIGSQLYFINNIANVNGGAILNAGSSTFSNSTLNFINNTADVSGGAIYLDNKTMKIENSTANFANNTSKNSGGAILNTGTATFDNSIVAFESNISTGSGGAIYLNGGTMEVKNSTVNFTGNVSYKANDGDGGGAIYVVNSSSMTFSGSNIKFTSNAASGGQGGAIYIDNSTVTVNGSALFENNTHFNYKASAGSIHGNDIYLAANATLNLNTGRGESIVLKGGIDSWDDVNSTYSTVNKNGVGSLVLGNSSVIYGDLNLNAGDLHLSEGYTHFASSVGIRTTNYTQKAGSNLYMSVYSKNNPNDEKEPMKNDQIIATNKVALNGNLKLFLGTGKYTGVYELIISSPNGSTGTFTGVESSTDSGGTFSEVQVNDEILSNNTSDMKIVYTWTDANYLTSDKNKVLLLLDVEYVSVSSFSYMPNLSYNQMQVAKNLDALSILSANGNLSSASDIISVIENARQRLYYDEDNGEKEVRNLLEYASGFLIANAIRAGSQYSQASRMYIYDKITNNRNDEKNNGSIWIQCMLSGQNYGDERKRDNILDRNSIGEYQTNSTGFMVGKDWQSYHGNLIGGVFGQYKAIDARQEQSQIFGYNFSAGVYGGFVTKFLEIKTTLLGGQDCYDTYRYLNYPLKNAANIGNIDVFVPSHIGRGWLDAFLAAGDIEIKLNVPLGSYLALGPYGGLFVQNTYYKNFTEDGLGALNLTYLDGNYLRTSGRFGLGLRYNKEDRVNICLGVEGEKVINGAEPEVKAFFEKTDISGVEAFISKGFKENGITVGPKLGVQVSIDENIRFFMNGAYYFGDDYNRSAVNVGIKYYFDKKTKSARKEKMPKSKPKEYKDADYYDPNEVFAPTAQEESQENNFVLGESHFVSANSYVLTKAALDKIKNICKSVNKKSLKKVTAEGLLNGKNAVSRDRLSWQRTFAAISALTSNGIGIGKIESKAFDVEMPSKNVSTNKAKRKVEISIE